MLEFRKYIESGYSVVPIKGKAAYQKNWPERYTSEVPPEELDSWERTKTIAHGFGIGLVCGGPADIIGLDLDTDDPIAQAEFKKIMPMSPLVREGRPGREIRIFRGAKAFGSTLSIAGFGQVLCYGAQFALPPSIHPITGKPYKWISEQTLLSIDYDDIPTLTREMLLPVFELAKKYAPEGSSPSSGRNDALKKVAWAMLSRGDSLEAIAVELYETDKRKHTPRLFTDTRDFKKCSSEEDAFNNAKKFCNSILKSFLKTKTKSYQYETEVEPETSTVQEKPLYELPEFPTGSIIRTIKDIISDYSVHPQPMFDLQGAIHIVNAACGGRYALPRAYPVLWTCCYGSTGFGKEAPKAIAKSVFSNQKLSHYNLAIPAKSASAQATIMSLPEKRVRLEIYDELSDLFFAVKMQSGLRYQQVCEYNELYSGGGDYYPGMSALVRGNKTGACFNPHLNLMGFIQPKLFEETITSKVIDSGFLPRMIPFFTDVKPNKNRDSLNKSIDSFSDPIADLLVGVFGKSSYMPSQYGKEGIEADIGKLRLSPRLLELSKEAILLRDELDTKLDSHIESLNDLERSLWSRASENASRLMISICLSFYFEKDKTKMKIEAEHVDLAYKLVMYCYGSSSKLLGFALDSEYGKLLRSARLFLEEKNILDKFTFNRRFRNAKSTLRNEIWSDLINSGYAKTVSERYVDGSCRIQFQKDL